jgi:serine protease SohB
VEFLNEYGIFLAKVVTIALFLLFIIAVAAGASTRLRKPGARELHVEKLNDQLEDAREIIRQHVLDKKQLKQLSREKKKGLKEKDIKLSAQGEKKRVYVLDFEGDIRASALDTFRDAVTAVLQVANSERDEVVVKLESPGGMVHAYGLAAAQLDRIRKNGLKLTACVDKVAASGGYMMACVADRIIASPFAVLGSIGVVAQLPNFHRLLKKHDIDVEILTAGEFKRTLTMFGENTEKAREKFRHDLEDTHELFKVYVAERRPTVDIERVANGDIWFGTRALEISLADELMTSDEYLCRACDEADVFSIQVKEKKNLADRIGLAVAHGVESSLSRLLNQFNAGRHLH